MSQDVPQKKFMPTAKQQAAIESLVSQGTPTQAARDAGVDRRTIHRWLDDAGFAATLRKAQAARQDIFNRQLVSKLEKVSSVLDDSLNDPRHRLRAAALVLDSLLKFRDADIEARLSELEQQIAQQHR